MSADRRGESSKIDRRMTNIVYDLPYEALSSLLRVIVLLLKKGRTYRTYRNPIVVIISVVHTY